jgi:hypothetical protein
MAGACRKAYERKFVAALDCVTYGNAFSDERAQVIGRSVPGAARVELAVDQ